MKHVCRVLEYCTVTYQNTQQDRTTALRYLGVKDDDVLLQNLEVSTLQRMFMVFKDVEKQTLVVVIRGTRTIKDVYINILGVLYFSFSVYKRGGLYCSALLPQ